MSFASPFPEVEVPSTSVYDFLFRNAYGAYLHLGVPPNRVIEIGQQVEI